ncbi:MAG: hypothetical protein EG828_03485 [Deltaproteobacteria bacterium]|nr:hypothetical protein [Deltaproteobacteria bacterium]
MKTCVKKFELSNSLTVLVYDATRRYYEDYHLVRLEIVCEVAVREDFFATPERLAEARGLLGNSVTYRRTVEKMGVPFVEIEQAREVMIDSFVATALPYFERTNFPQKFVQSELTRVSEKMLRSAV